VLAEVPVFNMASRRLRYKSMSVEKDLGSRISAQVTHPLRGITDA